MATIVAVQAGRIRLPAPRDNRPMTPIADKQYRDTFRAPVRDQDGATRPEMWAARSRDGRWTYERQDDGLGNLWTVTYVPTGQSRDGFGNSYAARRETAAKLLDELRAEAFVAALNGPIEKRRDGQRWLAKHMRMVGADEADARCVCGGLLVQATRGGAWGHVDGCNSCYRHGEGLAAGCHLVAEHRFCSTPIAIECSHWYDGPRVCGEFAAPNRGVGCGLGRVEDCCTQCCNGE